MEGLTIKTGKYKGRPLASLLDPELKDFVKQYKPQSTKGKELLAAAQQQLQQENLK